MTNEMIKAANTLGKLTTVVTIAILAVPSVSSAQKAPGLVEPVSDGLMFEVRYTATFSEDALVFGELRGYDTVRLRDGDWVNEPGKPMLPAQTVGIALPAGMAVTNVRLARSTSVPLAGEHTIFPGQPPRQTSGFPMEDEFLAPDPEAYTSPQAYPAKLVEFERQTDLAGQAIALVRLYPVQYVPADKTLTLHTSLELVLEGVAGYVCGDYLSQGLSARGRDVYQQMVTEMVVNPDDVQLQVSSSLAAAMRGVDPGTYDYVIITKTDWVAEFQDLADWRTQSGMPATIVDTSWIYGEYTGADNQERIRNFIIDAHTTWNASYFLLAGESATVPFKYRTYYDESTPSDQYYSDFDDDWTHEVFVGRLSVSSTTEIARVIEKIFTYEKNPPATDYAREVLLIGMDLDASTPCEDLKETIAGYITGFDPGFDITKVYDSDPGNHKTAALAALNAGKNLVNHADHAGYTSLCTGYFHHGWCIYRSDVDALVNDGELSVIVSLGCSPNGMTYGDCIAEHFVNRNTNQAGVAFTGNTRKGWYYGGYPESLSGVLDREWWRGLFEEDKHILGETLVFSKHNFSTDADEGKHCEWTFNVLGDPAMPIWTDDPQSLLVTHEDTWTVGAYTGAFPVEVYCGGSPLQYATVCLWKEGEVYEVEETDALGLATFDFTLAAPGVMKVTVTHHNRVPYTDDVEAYAAGNGDFDIDGDLDLADCAAFQRCFGELGEGPCQPGNMIGSGYIQLADFAQFAEDITGP